MDSNGKVRAIPELSIETRLLITLFREAAEEQLIPTESVEAIVGKPWKDSAQKVRTAQHRVLMDHGIIIAKVLRQGWKRCCNEGKVAVLQDGKDRVRRQVRKIVRQATTVEVENLPRDKQMEFHVAFSQLAMLEHATKTQTVKKIESAVNQSSKPLPIGTILEVLSK